MQLIKFIHFPVFDATPLLLFMPCLRRWTVTNDSYYSSLFFLPGGSVLAALRAYSLVSAFLPSTKSLKYPGTFSTRLYDEATGSPKISCTGTTPAHTLSITSSLFKSFLSSFVPKSLTFALALSTTTFKTLVDCISALSGGTRVCCHRCGTTEFVTSSIAHSFSARAASPSSAVARPCTIALR